MLEGPTPGAYSRESTPRAYCRGLLPGHNPGEGPTSYLRLSHERVRAQSIRFFGCCWKHLAVFLVEFVSVLYAYLELDS